MLAVMENITTAETVIAQLNVVSNAHRVFDTSVHDARLYGISSELIDELVAIGLRYQGDKEGRQFDSDDLYNVSLYLGLPSIHKMAMRSWAKVFCKADRPRHLKLTYGLQEGVKHVGICDVLTSHGGYVRVQPTDQTAIYHETVELAPSGVQVPADVRDLLNDLTREFAFYMLHDAIRWDLTFMQAQQIGECGGFSKLLVQEALARGRNARQVFGILASPPFGTGHYWAEFEIDGNWVKFDPLMIQLLINQKLLDPEVFGLDFSPAGALATLAVVSGYDAIGAPILSCQSSQVFLKEPVVVANGNGFPISITVEAKE